MGYIGYIVCNTMSKFALSKELNSHLTLFQYNKICKYWRCINKTSYKIKHFDYSKFDKYTENMSSVSYLYKETYDEYEAYADDAYDLYDDEILPDWIKYCRARIALKKLKKRLIYYEQEYEKYIQSIGFELNDASYDERLFNLLNNGIIVE